MKHNMKLKNEPYMSILSEKKDIEMRLYDEKRQKVHIGDTIEFTNITSGDSLLTEVLALYICKNFDELYQMFDKVRLGYKENEDANPSDMLNYYSKEEQDRYGVVGIRIKVLK